MNPETEKYVRLVLHKLCTMQADMRELQLRMIALNAHIIGQPSDGESHEWSARNAALRDMLYREAIQELGLPFDTTGDKSKN